MSPPLSDPLGQGARRRGYALRKSEIRAIQLCLVLFGFLLNLWLFGSILVCIGLKPPLGSTLVAESCLMDVGMLMLVMLE